VPAPTPVEADTSGVKEFDYKVVAAAAAGTKWSYRPPSQSPPPPEAKGLTLPVAFTETPARGGATTRSSFERYYGALQSSPASPFVYLKFTHEPPAQPKPLRVMKVDVSAGKLAATYDFPPDTMLLDVSPDGTRAVLRKVVSMHQQTRVDVFDISGPVAAHVVSFEPYKGVGILGHDVKTARFIDNDHLLTVDEEPRFTLWSLKGAAGGAPATVQSVWTYRNPFIVSHGLSPDRSALAVSAPDGLFFLEAKSAAVLGRVDAGGWVYNPSFNAAGTLLATLQGQTLLVWDLREGKLLQDLPLQHGVGGEPVYWLSDRQLLLYDRDLVDLDKGVVAWQYVQAGAGEPMFQVGNRIGMLGDGGGGVWRSSHVLNFFALPHPAAAKHAASLDPRNLMAVQPGSKVSLEINFQGPPEARQKVEANVRQQLQRNGVTVAEGQPVRLLVSSGEGELRGPEAARGQTGTQLNFRVAYIGGEDTVLWQVAGRSTQGAPVSRPLGQGKVLVPRDTRFAFFDSVRIPQLVPKPLAMVPAGRSDLSWRGPEKDTFPKPTMTEFRPPAPRPAAEKPPF
jgi:hypothetical protein